MHKEGVAPVASFFLFLVYPIFSTMSVLEKIHATKLLTAPSTAFKRHFEKEGNCRILFSGKFGIGKTYFINHFFSDEGQLKNFGAVKYNTFHIYPVNYSIATTEDIFKYVKYDIITSMLLRGVTLEEKDFEVIDAVPSFVSNNLEHILKALIYMIPKVGKDLAEGYEKIMELKEKLHGFYDKKITVEGDKLIDFVDLVKGEQASIYEEGVITKVISNVISRLKGETDDLRENVLIIDDLDRIDPEHIFRLLNVFAAHLDIPSGGSNKLGFDKVILVCDVNNIRNIFHAKYGSSTDFIGYIDKFYSFEVYHFDNREILKEISYKAIVRADFLGDNSQSSNYYNQKVFGDYDFAVSLLSALVGAGFVSLRSLLKPVKLFNIGRRIDVSRRLSLHQVDHSLLVQFKILEYIIGGYDAMLSYVDRLPVQQLPRRNFVESSGQFIRYLAMIDNDLELEDNQEHNFRVGHIQGKIKGRMGWPHHEITELAIKDEMGTTRREFIHADLKYLLLRFIEVLKQIDN